MASSCLLPRSQFPDLLITDCCDSMSEEEERCELSATYRSRRKIKMALIDQQSKRVKAFHEKAGRSQGNSGFIVSFCSLSQRKVFLPPSSNCRHASIRTLEERSVFARCMWGVLNSAGAAICLATSRCTQEWNVAQAINAVTGTRLWLLSFLFLERF